MRTIFLIGNPAAGRKALKKINEAAAIIKSRGYEVRVLLTAKRGDAESFAKEIAVNQPQNPTPPSSPPLSRGGSGGVLIIAAGGDGTFNEVINGIVHTSIPMAILPLGTTNVLAQELGISDDVEKALDAALDGKAHNVCLGKITLSKNISRYFCLMAGIGYDAETVYGVKNEVKKYSGKGAYILSGLRTLTSWKPDKLTFSVNGKSSEGYSAIICKASKYAGNFRVAPDADLEKNNFYAFIMHGRKRSDIIKYVCGIVAGKRLKFKGITYEQAENIEVRGKAHVQIDGDYFGMTPAVIETVPDALRLVY